MRHTILYITMLACCMLASCAKAPLTNGDPVTQDRPITQPFSKIDMHDNIDVTLVKSTDGTQHVEVTSGENVIDNIVTEVKGDTLVIANENALDWIRSYDCPFDVTIYYNSIGSINYYSVGSLTSTDSITGAGDDSGTWFYLNIFEGSGDIDLGINCRDLRVNYKYGTSEVKLHGRAAICYIFHNSFGPLEAENLWTNMTWIVSNSTCYSRVWAETYLCAMLHGLGNTYYKGSPEIEYSHDSSGLLLPLEE